MAALRPWQQLEPAGAVVQGKAERVRTGGWRTGVQPQADLSRCVDCLLCWLYCPDSAVVLEGTAFAGFDLEVCKGCEICAEMCPVGAIEMVPDA
jgi:2-oxoacid:acceptor oxidoreductase delta subunit (pyruvate/2-ketoisovalerate family)